MTESTRNTLVAIKSETTEGTDAFLTDPDTFIDAVTCSIIPQRTRVPNAGVRAVHSGIASKSFASHCEVSMSGYLTGKEDAAGDAPLYAALLKASGLKETPNASTNVIYAPVTAQTMANCPSMTVYQYRRHTDGTYRLYKATGVRGNLTITYTMSGYVMWSFEGMGKYEAVGTSTIAGPSDPTAYGGNKSPLLVNGLTFQVGGSDFEMSSFEFSTNWSLEEVRTATGSSELDYIKLIRGEDSHIGGSLEFMKSDEFETVLTNHGADTEFALSASVSDGTDTIALAAPKAQFDMWSLTEGNLNTFAVPVMLNGEWDGSSEAGDNDFSLTYT